MNTETIATNDTTGGNSGITIKTLITLRKKLEELYGNFCLVHGDAFISDYIGDHSGTPEEQEAASILNSLLLKIDALGDYLRKAGATERDLY